MNDTLKKIRTAVLATSFIVGSVIAGTANAGPAENSVKLLTANFASRQVVQIEGGAFYFRPGQVAPVHTHVAPAVGYITKGAIIFQVEGEKPRILREGDVFYEPAGPRILRFDNFSATEGAVFIDFNLEQVGEPFIQFEKPPTEAIDRRTLPTSKLAATSVDHVDLFENTLKPSGTREINNTEPTLGVVASGVIELQVEGEKTLRIAAGSSFALPKVGTKATIINASDEVSARVVTFHLL